MLKDLSRLLSFSYKDSKGNVTERMLIHWRGISIYIQGRDETADFYRTFREDQVIEYFKGVEYLSFEGAPHLLIATAPIDVREQILFAGFKFDDRAALENLQSAMGYELLKRLLKIWHFYVLVIMQAGLK